MARPVLLETTRTGKNRQDLDRKLRSLVVGQDEAIHESVTAYQSHRTGLSPTGRSVGNFLFLGPTGSGKTRIVEATAQSLSSEARAMIKIDCAEYRHSHDVAKLVGSPPGYLGHRETHPLLSQRNRTGITTTRSRSASSCSTKSRRLPTLSGIFSLSSFFKEKNDVDV